MKILSLFPRSLIIASAALLVLPAAAQLPGERDEREASIHQIEIIVFRHADAPLLPPRIPKNYMQNRVPLLDLEVTAGVAAAADAESAGPVVPKTLAEIAKRLAQFGNYSVLLHETWQQYPGVWPNPPVKWLHGDQPLTARSPPNAYSSPWSAPDQPAPATSAAQGTIERTGEQNISSGVVSADRVYYQLEGTAGFARQRFYHLGLDFEFRSYDQTGQPAAVDRLNQSRRIELGQVEYFDTPGLAAIALVTRLEPKGEAVDAALDF